MIREGLLRLETSELESFISETKFFSGFDQDLIAKLVDRVEIVSFDPGELVFDESDDGDSFYVVYSGRIRIVKRREEGEDVNLGTKSKGDHFGETALFTDENRTAAARAAGETVLLKFNNEIFEDLIQSDPELKDYLDRFIHSNSVHAFLKSCTELSDVPAEELRAAVEKFREEFHDEGDVVIRQGTAPDKFYLVEEGTLKVERSVDGEKEIINILREGDFFGERAFLKEEKRYADVSCVTDCRLFSLDEDDFQDLVGESPDLKDSIEERMESYSGDEPPVPYEEILEEETTRRQEMDVTDDVDQEEVEPSEDEKSFLSKLPVFYYQNVKFPFVQQYDQRECGIACMRMIGRYYGKNFSASRLQEMANMGKSGTNMANLSSAAEKLGFTTRGMNLDYETLQSAHMPCIVHWEGYHYVVVYKITDDHVWVADPAVGLKKYPREEFEDSWTGVTLLIEPTPEFEETEEDTSTVGNFLQFLKPHKWVLAEIFLASLLMNIFGLATPIFTQITIDRVITHGNVSLLNMMFVGMLLVLSFQFLTRVIRRYLIVHTSLKIDLRMLIFFYRKLLALPMSFLDARKVGDFVTRFSENLKIRNFLTNTAMTLVLDTVLIVVYLGLMFYYNAQMTGIVMLFIPLLALITFLFTPRIKRLEKESFAEKANQKSHLIESINGIQTVKAMNVERPTRWQWENKFINYLNLDFQRQNTITFFDSATKTIVTLASTIILWFGAHKVIEGQLTVGELMAFVALLGSALSPIERTVKAWDEFQDILNAMNRLNDVLQAESEEDSEGISLSEPRGKVEYEDVYFRYGGENDPYVLSNINLTVEPGETAAIVGRSGSGKSTLVSLLARFYDPEEGSVSIDGFDVRNISLDSLRSEVGYVLQDSFIFDRTIRENIALADAEEGKLEDVIQAAKMANAHDFITDLALGYDTQIGESGINLSGGQEQRVSIARVLYKDPSILIFDEATSSLDSESEQAIQKNLDTILEDRTALVIAHRFSTIRDADKIIVLDQGEIIERGTHEELMEERGLYHYLTNQQMNM